MLSKGENTRTLRPTLFDLLAFRAIHFFQNDEKDLTQPAFHFVMDDAAAFAPSAQFAKHKFVTQDSASMQHRALQLYAEVLRLHADDASPNALLDADLQRLAFAYAQSVLPDKKMLYRNALEEIENGYRYNPLTAMASYTLATLMMADEEAPEDEDDNNAGAKRKAPHDNRPAVAKLKAIIAQFPESEGGIAAVQLLHSIQAPTLSITTEEAVLPDVPSRVLVTYKNVPRAYFRIVKMNPDDYHGEGRYDNDGYIKKLLRLKPGTELQQGAARHRRFCAAYRRSGAGRASCRNVCRHHLRQGDVCRLR